jgi:hypothetical protein
MSLQAILENSEKLVRASGEGKKYVRAPKKKKSVSWNMTGDQPPQEATPTTQPPANPVAFNPTPTEDPKEVYVEELNLSNFDDDVEPESDEQESISVVEEDEGFRTTTEIMNSFQPLALNEVAKVTDSHPLRTSCFNADGDYFVLGTNSKSIKI